MMCYITKTTPIHVINGECHIKQMKSGKSHKTSLSNHTQSISCHIIPLVTNALKGGHTDWHRHTHTDVQTKVISRNKVWAKKAKKSGVRKETKAILRNQVCASRRHTQATGSRAPSLKILLALTVIELQE